MDIQRQQSSHGIVGPTLGLIVNPFSGLGGSVGLKGSDGFETVQEALRRGAVPQANRKAGQALQAIRNDLPQLRIVTADGAMGEWVAQGAEVIHRPDATHTTGNDTTAAAQAMSNHAVDLILFVGGDGTARDVAAGTASSIPILGVPAGVKMHSSVFAKTAKNAGRLAALFLAGSRDVTLREAEIMDLDEELIRQDRVSARLYGHVRSPYLERLSQNAKAGARPGEEATADAIARKVVSDMRPGCLYILGPGTTTRRVAMVLGLGATLLGVDAVVDGKLVGQDLDERGILDLMQGRETWLVVGVLGGQGSLFGRGNQQISAEVIRRVGRQRIIVMASVQKLIALGNQPLSVDTGDDAVDTMLTGHLRIQTGPDQQTIFAVQS
ncbi:ATP-NAD kinase family protein (plasmid) [Gemmobacter fulvus]|uniref:ATP-NAD kinase family protein n=1 Tax=Gemmobacter fulvus TaxID=2840474 RepID=A0A975S495_9RHOB|nr:ATP-NAD kinase family protein [Gemmobacter fulvus]MBT9247939.1 ATP-NAD kinase family protein [Gemmobacter fulvus]QWK92843.1 ATP-NAD kinase family protein [Gemmobacter fulvus]